MRPYGDRARLWFNLPGVYCAYQPKGAPGFAASLHDIRHDRQAVGIRDAGIGTAPAWDIFNGWKFSPNKYLTTTFIPENGPSQAMLVQFTNLDPQGALQYFAGVFSDSRFNAGIYVSGGNFWQYGHGDFENAGPHTATAGNMGLSGPRGYKDGVDDGVSLSGVTGNPSLPVHIGRRNRTSPDGYMKAHIQAVAIYDRELSPAEVRLAAYQMAHLDNPEYSAWSLIRRWWPGYVAAEEEAAPSRLPLLGVG
jgi:hypothetical protein